MPIKPDEKYVKEGAKKVKSRDFLTVIQKSNEIRERFRSKGPLHRFMEDGKLFLAIVKDYWTRRYRKVPYGIIAAAVFVLVYVINPFDIVPDFLPVIGELDDAAVIGAALMFMERDLFKYRDWKLEQDKTIEGTATPATPELPDTSAEE